jgi:flagellin-like protein
MRSGLRKHRKRGVSPLIATVLLISFAVALGAVVMNWGRSLPIAKPGDKCGGVSIIIRNINDAEVCYSGAGQNAYINFIIDNDGSIDIEGLGIWIVGEKGTKLLDFDDFSIKKGNLLDIKDNSVSYDFGNYGKIKHVQFIPKIKVDNSIDICPRNSVKAELIRACQ